MTIRTQAWGYEVMRGSTVVATCTSYQAAAELMRIMLARGL